MKEITLFNIGWHSDCQRAKALLRENEINFMKIDVYAVADATKDVMRKKEFLTLVIASRELTSRYLLPLVKES